MGSAPLGVESCESESTHSALVQLTYFLGVSNSCLEQQQTGAEGLRRIQCITQKGNLNKNLI